MQTASFFTRLLGLSSPYSISKISDQKDEKGQLTRIDIYISIASDYLPPVDEGIKVWEHGRSSRTWRHLDLFQYPCYLHCAVPKYKYQTVSKTYSRTLEVPWARLGSHFSLQFEQMVMSLLEINGCVSETSKIVKASVNKI